MNEVCEVWIAETGEDHEGGRICGVFSTKDRAYAFAKQRMAEQDWCKWDDDDPVDLEPLSDMYWHNDGCDWFSVSCHGVDEL